MATTARLPQGLKDEAEAYAKSLGISLNALLSVALRDYLDARRTAGPSAGAGLVSLPEPGVINASSAVAGILALAQPAAVRRSRAPKVVPVGVAESRQQRRERERKESKAAR